MEKRVDVVSAVVVFFILLFVYTKFAGPIQFSVNNTNTAATAPFEVQGTGKASAVPNRALANIGITESSSTVLDAQNKTNQVSERIINALKALGIPEKDIKTTSYFVIPNYSFSGETQRITGYSVTQNFEVKAPIDKASQIVDAATASGANLVGGVTFTLDDKKLEDLKNEARKQAVDNAKASAQGLAQTAGIKLGKIVNISESFGGEGPTPIFAREAVGAPEDQTKTNITPGESNVEVTVTLTYQTL